MGKRTLVGTALDDDVYLIMSASTGGRSDSTNSVRQFTVYTEKKKTRTTKYPEGEH